MNKQQIQLVWETFERLRPLPPGWGLEFYDRLFELDPTLKPLFKTDLSSQSRMFESALALAVSGMNEDLSVVRKLVSDLGARHAAYGIPPGSLETFGSALLWTLRGRLGEAFTPEVEEAWREAYHMLVSAMLRGAGIAGA